MCLLVNIKPGVLTREQHEHVKEAEITGRSCRCMGRGEILKRSGRLKEQ